ncbi:T9SS type A sorting domain-containing protein [Flavobacterium sp. F372]|uniref:T9SS type A sorting domain-containing protein n=1 Tax=Flavobacterium bernardetii TaxID=2813823 RepID=A0ABR7IX02_9FLAO|nr:T9SS type A sorting domain-containing protein [Flavobacterium bernardetii]MBC5834184.1 T9SS type A sorting domain-containing protein [Flavobacterium bernardetii]NHF69416.1 T9SS type A sorting domain-containing protein [Flavobacterium bernardetii]
MKKLLTYILFFAAFSAFSQSFQWLKRGGSVENPYADNEATYSIATDSEKNYYVLSKVAMSGLNVDGYPKINFDNPGSTPKDVVLASFACDGTYRWSKIFGGSGDETINSVVVDSQDNVYVGGSMGDCHPYPGTPTEPYPSRIDSEYFFSNTGSACSLTFFAKFNKNGVLQYVKRPSLPTLNGSGSGWTFNFQMQNDIIYWYLWLKPGTYADGGFTNSNTDSYTPYVLKYNLDGTFISATQLGTVQTYDSSVVKYYRNPHNGYYYATIIKESSFSTFYINGQPIVNFAALVCYDNNGTFLWKRENTYTDSGSMKFFGLEFDSLNNIYIAGGITGLNMDSFLGFSNSSFGTAFVMKTNPTAISSLWVSNPNNSGGFGSFAGLLINNSEVAFTSGFASLSMNLTWGSQSISVPGANQGSDVLLARINSATGACLSLNKITSNTPSTDFGAAIVKDASGDYIIGGGFGGTLYDVNNNTVVNEGGDSDFFISKFSTQACLPLSSESFEEAKMNIYPNPVQNVFTVPVKENTTYQLFTLTGVLIKQGSINTTENTISISEFASGCYLLHLQSETGKRESVKVIKE